MSLTQEVFDDLTVEPRRAGTCLYLQTGQGLSPSSLSPQRAHWERGEDRGGPLCLTGHTRHWKQAYLLSSLAETRKGLMWGWGLLSSWEGREGV